jgi:hypothetical protein
MEGEEVDGRRAWKGQDSSRKNTRRVSDTILF